MPHVEPLALLTIQASTGGAPSVPSPVETFFNLSHAVLGALSPASPFRKQIQEITMKQLKRILAATVIGFFAFFELLLTGRAVWARRMARRDRSTKVHG